MKALLWPGWGGVSCTQRGRGLGGQALAHHETLLGRSPGEQGATQREEGLTAEMGRAMSPGEWAPRQGQPEFIQDVVHTDTGMPLLACGSLLGQLSLLARGSSDPVLDSSPGWDTTPLPGAAPGPLRWTVVQGDTESPFSLLPLCI